MPSPETTVPNPIGEPMPCTAPASQFRHRHPDDDPDRRHAHQRQHRAGIALRSQRKNHKQEQKPTGENRRRQKKKHRQSNKISPQRNPRSPRWTSTRTTSTASASSKYTARKIAAAVRDPAPAISIKSTSARATKMARARVTWRSRYNRSAVSRGIVAGNCLSKSNKPVRDLQPRVLFWLSARTNAAARSYSQPSTIGRS